MRRPVSAPRAVAVVLAVTGLVATLALTGGCSSTATDADPDAAQDPVRAPDVAASALGRELGLRTSKSPDGRMSLEAGEGARILLFPGTTVATVGGRKLELAQTLAAAGGDVWIGAADAQSIRQTWRTQVASGLTPTDPVASPGYRVPIPDAPSNAPVATPAPAPRPAAAVTAFGDNRPTSGELSAWSVPLKRKWLFLVVHHSASAVGNAAQIDRWHRDRGFDGLGYDFVIGNGTGSGDGVVEVGYRWKQQLVGAHAKTAGNFMNEHGIGICLVGDFTRTKPTAAQMRSLDRLCTFLAQYCGIPAAALRMHGDVKSTECPGKYFPRDFAVRLPSSGRTQGVSASTD